MQLQDEKEELELRVDQLNKEPVVVQNTEKENEDDERIRELELRLANATEHATSSEAHVKELEAKLQNLLNEYT